MGRVAYLYHIQIINSPVYFVMISEEPPSDFWLSLKETDPSNQTSLDRVLQMGHQAEVRLIGEYSSVSLAREEKVAWLRLPEQNLPDRVTDRSQTAGHIRCIVCHQPTSDHSCLPGEMICRRCRTIENYSICRSCNKAYQMGRSTHYCDKCRGATDYATKNRKYLERI